MEAKKEQPATFIVSERRKKRGKKKKRNGTREIRINRAEDGIFPLRRGKSETHSHESYDKLLMLSARFQRCEKAAMRSRSFFFFSFFRVASHTRGRANRLLAVYRAAIKRNRGCRLRDSDTLR